MGLKKGPSSVPLGISEENLQPAWLLPSTQFWRTLKNKTKQKPHPLQTDNLQKDNHSLGTSKEKPLPHPHQEDHLGKEGASLGCSPPLALCWHWLGMEPGWISALHPVAGSLPSLNF